MSDKSQPNQRRTKIGEEWEDQAILDELEELLVKGDDPSWGIMHEALYELTAPNVAKPGTDEHMNMIHDVVKFIGYFTHRSLVATPELMKLYFAKRVERMRAEAEFGGMK